MPQVIGFIGLGTMGGPMAANLQKAGYSLIVHDLNRKSADALIEGGAEWADSPKDLAAKSDAIFISLPGPADVEGVCMREDGILAGLQPGGIVLDLSTNSPTMVRKLETIFREKGGHFLDAPISGGPAGAISGKLAFWVGGEADIYEKCKPLLDAMGDEVSRIGEIGAGTVAKLVHNLSGQAIQAVLAEAFTLGVKAGVDARTLHAAVSQGMAGRRQTFDGLLPVFAGRFDPPPAVFALSLARKDIALACALGRELDVPLRMSNMLLEEMTEAIARGWGGRASQATTLLQMERAGASLVDAPEEEAKAS